MRFKFRVYACKMKKTLYYVFVITWYMKMIVLWDVASRGLVDFDRRFRASYGSHHKNDKKISLVELTENSIYTLTKNGR
jgi:hypothetical protein